MIKKFQKITSIGKSRYTHRMGGGLISKDYFDTGEGVIIKNEGGRTAQESLLLKYNVSGDIKKVSSPRYMAYNNKINCQLLVDKHNKRSSFIAYIEHDGYDIRFRISYELMSLVLEIRNSMYDLPPIINPFYNTERSMLMFDNLYFTPKLVEVLSKKRIPITEHERQNILLKNSKEILALNKKHKERLIELLIDEETKIEDKKEEKEDDEYE